MRAKSLKKTAASKPQLIEHIDNWEWSTTIAALRYFQYRMTIASAMFPADVIEHFWKSGKYSTEALSQLATQFVKIDHHGEKDWTDGRFSTGLFACDKEPWCMFHAFCKAWCDGFKMVLLDDGKGHKEKCEVFYCEYTKHWHPKDKYISNPRSNFWCPDEFIKEIKEGEAES